MAKVPNMPSGGGGSTVEGFAQGCDPWPQHDGLILIDISLGVFQPNVKNLTASLMQLILAFRVKVKVVPPTPVKGFETNNNTASAGYRKRLVYSTFTLIWPLSEKQKNICYKEQMPKV